MTLEEAAEALRGLRDPGTALPKATFQVVGRHERGVTYPGSSYRRAYAILYRVAEADLGFATAVANAGSMGRALPGPTAHQNTAPAEQDSFSAWVPSRTITLATHLTTEDFVVNRREALSAIPAFVTASISLPSLEQWLIGPGSLDATQPSGNRPVAIIDIEHIEAAAQIFRSWDANFGGGLRRKAVVGQLNEVAELIAEGPRSTAITMRLFLVMAQLAETAATMAWDSGDGSTAWRYYTLALRAAKESGDRPFGANVLAGMARQLLYLDRPAQALDLIRLAEIGVAGFATPKVSAMLRTREAWAYAKMNRIESFRRVTDLAERELNLQTSNSEPYWIDYFDYAEFAGVTGGRFLDLAHTDQRHADSAVVWIDRAIELRRSQNLRSRALDSVGLVEARLLQGDVYKAIALADQALDVVARTQSARARKKVGRLLRSTQKLPANQQVSALQRRAREIIASQSRMGRS